MHRQAFREVAIAHDVEDRREGLGLDDLALARHLGDRRAHIEASRENILEHALTAEDPAAIRAGALQRALHAGAQLVLVERLAALVGLDHPRHDQLGGLEGGEALAALEALATATDLRPFARQTRIRHLGFDVAAEGTVHASEARFLRVRIQGSAGTAPEPEATPSPRPLPSLRHRARRRSNPPPARSRAP